jgi:hypothetical protein
MSDSEKDKNKIKIKVNNNLPKGTAFLVGEPDLQGHREIVKIVASTEQEGQLKQQIRNIGYGESIDGDSYPASFDEIFKVLDEAKKEYPTEAWATAEYLRRVKKEYVSSGLDVAGVDRVLASERNIWFLKWFGHPND